MKTTCSLDIQLGPREREREIVDHGLGSSSDLKGLKTALKTALETGIN